MLPVRLIRWRELLRRIRQLPEGWNLRMEAPLRQMRILIRLYYFRKLSPEGPLSLIHNGTAYEGVHLRSKDSSNLALTGGKVYEYNVKVNRTGLAVSSSAIHGWNDELPDKDIDINL